MSALRVHPVHQGLEEHPARPETRALVRPPGPHRRIRICGAQHRRDRGHAFREPVGVRLVECGPLPLGDLVIRGVSDQGVTEPKSIVTRHQRSIGPDQLLAHEGEQVPAHVHAFRLGQQGGDSAAMEEASLDRASLGCCALVLTEAVDTRREQGLEGRRHLEPLAVLRLHRRELLDEERVALRGTGDAIAQLVVERGDDPGRLGADQDRVRVGRIPSDDVDLG